MWSHEEVDLFREQCAVEGELIVFSVRSGRMIRELTSTQVPGGVASPPNSIAIF